MKNYLNNALGRAHLANVEGVDVKLPGQVRSHGGGFAFEITPEVLLERFLVLGTTTSQYVGPDKLAVEALGRLLPHITLSPVTAARTAVEAVEQNRVLSKVPALFVYATAHTMATDGEHRRAIAMMLPRIVNTFSDLQTLLGFVANTHNKGIATSLVKACRRYLYNMPIDRMVNQALKYRKRAGWAVLDMLRVIHPIPKDNDQNYLYGYIVENDEARAEACRRFPMVAAFEAAKVLDDHNLIVKLIKDNGLTWEHVPTEHLNNKWVWKALLPNLPMTALIRNLPKISSVGAIDDTPSLNTVLSKLTPEIVAKAKVHPFRLYLAWYGYGQGGNRNMSWTPNQRILAALETCLYASFANVEVKGKVCIGSDISGSMWWDDSRINRTGPYAGDAAGMLAATFKAANPETDVFYFAGQLAKAAFDPMVLSSVRTDMNKHHMGSTNPGLLIEKAIRDKVRYDAFVVLTDNDVNGGYHAKRLLDTYRATVNPKAKLIVVGMTANNFSIASPDDVLSMDIAGMDAGIMTAIEKFIAM